jgi:uncharacterized membrane protein
MKLIPQWKLWYRRFSTWIITMIPLIELLRQNLPSLQVVMPSNVYQITYAVLVVLAVVAMQIKQESVSGVGDQQADA